MFDEPSSYLDVKQRLKTAAVIRNVIGHELDLRQKYDTLMNPN
jgi:translation initiation factor RLI1